MRSGGGLLAEVVKEVDTARDQVGEAEVEIETKQRTAQYKYLSVA